MPYASYMLRVCVAAVTTTHQWPALALQVEWVVGRRDRLPVLCLLPAVDQRV
jgi:hypothetical protein